jgi:hypothetical protein
VQNRAAEMRVFTSISGLELWRFLRLRYFVDTLSSGSAVGKAGLFDSGLKTEVSTP